MVTNKLSSDIQCHADISHIFEKIYAWLHHIKIKVKEKNLKRIKQTRKEFKLYFFILLKGVIDPPTLALTSNEDLDRIFETTKFTPLSLSQFSLPLCYLTLVSFISPFVFGLKIQLGFI